MVLVLIGLALIPFFNPVWLGFEQDRADAAAFTGWTPAQVRTATEGLLHDLVVGPPDFAMTVDGQPVFDPRERAHMRDVRGVFADFALGALAGLVAIVVLGLASRGAAWFWRGIAVGGAIVAGAVVLLGVFFGIAFDTAFDLFHRLFFPAGSYDFNVATERLVQLLPEQLWYETSLAFGGVLFVLGAIAATVGLRRATAVGVRR